MASLEQGHRIKQACHRILIIVDCETLRSGTWYLLRNLIPVRVLDYATAGDTGTISIQ